MKKIDAQEIVISTVDKHRSRLRNIDKTNNTNNLKTNGKPPELIQDQQAILDEANLKPLLPQWLRETGELLNINKEVMGQLIPSSRGRYTGENGDSLEIEISDAGTEVTDTLIKALGFDLDQTDIDDTDGYKFTQKEDDILINEEYDFNDQSGSLQVLVARRYLIEIQIAQMPEETFQKILDEQIPFDEIYRRLKE